MSAERNVYDLGGRDTQHGFRAIPYVWKKRSEELPALLTMEAEAGGGTPGT